uniref:MY15B protein n=1 Tax=Junco hyemalis TaxID=40217 RepID=A0A8C5IR67_JUNHY
DVQRVVPGFPYCKAPRPPVIRKSLLQATDHTFLQKCHYHHGNSPWYSKPKLPLPEFTVQHYAGPVTYQVHKFLNKNRDQLRPEVLDIFSQSRLKVVSEIFQRLRGRGLRPQASTLVSKFQQSLQDLTARLRGSHAFFIRCITPNPRKLSNVFDVEYVNCQLRHSGILEAIHILKEGFPVHLPFQSFLASPGGFQREGCAAVLAHVVGNPSDLYQIGVTKVMSTDNLIWIAQPHPPCPGWQSRRGAQPLPTEGGPCTTSPLTFASCPNQGWVRGSAGRGAGQQELLCELLVSCHPTRPPSLAGRHQAQANQITETQPPEVKVKDDLSLPPTINSHPFSSFIKSHFQVGTLFLPSLPPLWLQFSLSCPGPFQILRFIGDQSLHGWQEVLLGNFIAGRGLRDAALRDEIFSQVVAQSWRNPDTERGRRGWLLMATLLSCFGPSPALQKPLLKFVSDYGMEGYSAVCQRKMLRAAQCMGTGPAPARAYPPTQLEWTANQRRGKMVLDVHTFNEEEFSAEVESWMTGEQYAAWILSARGCDKNTRGWSVSMFTGNTWQDLLGCDFVLDLIGEMEDTSNFISSSQAPTEYPITPERDRSILQPSDLDTAPEVLSGVAQDILIWDSPKHCALVLLPLGLSGMTQTPVYQPMPSMVGMPAAMPMMPGVGGVAPMPAMVMPQPMVPAVDPSQLAAQQQAFINQQAMLMAQQMTLQAMTISQQQQQQELQKQQKSLENSRPRASSPAQASAPATLPKPKKPPSSQAAAAPSRSPEDFSCVFAGLLIKALIPTAPASPMPPPEPKPKKETPKPKKEPPVVKPSGPEKRPAPSHEIGNIIKMYQSRPAPEPQPIQPSRKVSKPFIKKNDPKNEALAKLGMMNPSPQRSKKIPPPVKPKPGPASSSIKEKQLPLLSIFKPEGAPPAAQAPYAPPLPPATPEDQGRQEPPGKGEYLFHPCGIWSYLCNICNTTIALLLQVFYPKENFSHPYCLNLLCEQVISAPLGVRASQSRQRNIPWVSTEEGIKKRIVVAARDNWANYFSRLFPVQGEKGSDVQLLGVSHRGMRLLKVEKAAGYHPEHLKILRSYCFAEVLSVEMKGSNSLEFSLKTEQLILHSPKAPCIKDMVELFMQELRQDTNYVVALRSYIVDDKSLLSFNKGDLIELLPMQGVEPGWQFGSMGGRCGLFPTSLVQLAPAIDYLSSSMDRRGDLGELMNTSQGLAWPTLPWEVV